MRWTQGSGEPLEAATPAEDYSSQENAFSVDPDEGLFGESGPVPLPEKKAPALMFQSLPELTGPPVDVESALDRFGGDRDAMTELFWEYWEQLGGRIQEIRAAVDDCDANRLVRLAHNFKGVSLNFSADRLAALARHLEENGRHEDLSAAPVLCAQLEAEALRVKEYLSENRL